MIPGVGDVFANAEPKARIAPTETTMKQAASLAA
jgi:hypothetical protein